jgi:hypothetical protein
VTSTPQDLKLEDAEQAALYTRVRGDLVQAHPAHALTIASEHLRKLSTSTGAGGAGAGEKEVERLVERLRAADEVVALIDAQALSDSLAPRWTEESAGERGGREVTLLRGHLG